MPVYQTQTRKMLLDYLQSHADESLSAGKISEDLPQISVSAVYRNLAALEEEGRIRRVSRGGGREAYYQYTDTEACRTHLHLLCKTCGATYHMDKTDADQLIRILAEHEKFAVDTVDTVLYGTCEACQIRERMRAKHEKE